MSIKRYLLISWRPRESGGWTSPKYDVFTDTSDNSIKQTAESLSQRKASRDGHGLGRRVEVYPLPELPLCEYVAGEAVHHE